MKKQFLILPVLGIAVSVLASHFDGSRTIPVHRIPLADETGEKIISTVPNAMPFSTKMTCGACHDYEAIHGGTHFSGAKPNHPTEPWMVINEATGTQVPADRMNLSAWEFTKRFGRHLPGGGISDPADKLADPDARWDISGGLEINCLACHNNAHRQDPTEWAKQIGRENFRWAATAAAGLGEVLGMASRLPDWWNMYTGANPDDSVFAVPPSVNYDTSLFDSKHRMWFDIGKPQDKSCLQCHSSAPVGVERHHLPVDVHAAAGLNCVDCHNHGEDHQMLRPFEELQCGDCHSPDGRMAGHLGAPIADHKGLPPVHLDKIACVTCHSGLSPASTPHAVRTSRANRLGIYGRAQWFTESPFIIEPVFVRNKEGKIEAQRMMWPAFWAYADGIPIDLDLVEQAAQGILDAPQQVGALLSKLATTENAPGTPLYAAGGKLYRRNTDGGLDLVGSMNTQETWLWDTGSNIVSTIPTFDVKAEELDYNAEGAILAFLNALKPIDAVLVTQGKMFSEDEDSYLRSTNTTLTSGWYTSKSQPLVVPFVQRAIVDTVGSTKAFNEEQVALVLKKLGNNTCYISNGRKYLLAADGSLKDEDDPAATPISWPIAHTVRSAAQSLGATECQECHAPNSNFLFGKVTATGPLLTDRAPTVPMHQLEELNSSFHKMFGLTFKVRKCFKGGLSMLMLALSLIVLAIGLPRLSRLIDQLGETNRIQKLVGFGLAGALAILAITGFLTGWPLGGFALLMHVGFGLLYAVALVTWALLRAKSGGSVWFWLLIVCGIVLITSILLAMFPLLSTHGQHNVLVVHRVAATLTLVAAVMSYISAKKNN